MLLAAAVQQSKSVLFNHNLDAKNTQLSKTYKKIVIKQWRGMKDAKLILELVKKIPMQKRNVP